MLARVGVEGCARDFVCECGDEGEEGGRTVNFGAEDRGESRFVVVRSDRSRCPHRISSAYYNDEEEQREIRRTGISLEGKTLFLVYLGEFGRSTLDGGLSDCLGFRSERGEE